MSQCCLASLWFGRLHACRISCCCTRSALVLPEVYQDFVSPAKSHMLDMQQSRCSLTSVLLLAFWSPHTVEGCFGVCCRFINRPHGPNTMHTRQHTGIVPVHHGRQHQLVCIEFTVLFITGPTVGCGSSAAAGHGRSCGLQVACAPGRADLQLTVSCLATSNIMVHGLIRSAPVNVSFDGRYRIGAWRWLGMGTHVHAAWRAQACRCRIPAITQWAAVRCWFTALPLCLVAACCVPCCPSHCLSVLRPVWVWICLVWMLSNEAASIFSPTTAAACACAGPTLHQNTPSHQVTSPCPWTLNPKLFLP